MKNYRCIYLAFFCSFLNVAEGFADEYIYSDVNVKAAYIFNIPQFISNAQGIIGSKNLVNICVIGDDLIGITLAKLAGDSDSSNNIKVSKKQSTSNFRMCDVVYVSLIEVDALNSILYKLNEVRAITISDIEGFASQGGMVEFTVIRNKIRMIINNKAAHRVGLLINAKLLSLAHEVL